MLGIPRPRTIGACREESRPCPWVGCRHHLLLEVRTHGNSPPGPGRETRPKSLRLNAPNLEPNKLGRKPGLSASAPAALVRMWIDDALELLSRMRYTCTFDVVRDHPDGLEEWEVGELLGVTHQGAHWELRRARLRLLMGLKKRGVTHEND